MIVGGIGLPLVYHRNEAFSSISKIWVITESPEQTLWLSYDQEADVLTINFHKPSSAIDSELTDDDIIIRYKDEEVIGLTILHAGSRPTE